MIGFKLLHPDMTLGHLGNIPMFLDADDQRSAREQLDAGYKFAGGWQPFNGFTLNDDYTLSYPGDPPMQPLALAVLRNERIVLYECSWVAIIQPDRSRSFEVARLD
jgi:hypothetical protein